MAKKNLRCVPQTGTVQQLISDGYSELLCLCEEADEIVQNAPESLFETDRIQTFSSTVDALSDADSEPDVPECVAELPITYYVDQRKSKSTSRATRCGEACDLLDRAVGELDDWLSRENSEDDDGEEARASVVSLRDEVQNMIDNAQGTDWPGMYG